MATHAAAGFMGTAATCVLLPGVLVGGPAPFFVETCRCMLFARKCSQTVRVLLLWPCCALGLGWSDER